MRLAGSLWRATDRPYSKGVPMGFRLGLMYGQNVEAQRSLEVASRALLEHLERGQKP